MGIVVDINDTIFTKDINNQLDDLSNIIKDYCENLNMLEQRRIIIMRDNIDNLSEKEIVDRIDIMISDYSSKMKELKKKFKKLVDEDAITRE